MFVYLSLLLFYPSSLRVPPVPPRLGGGAPPPVPAQLPQGLRPDPGPGAAQRGHNLRDPEGRGGGGQTGGQQVQDWKGKARYT